MITDLVLGTFIGILRALIGALPEFTVSLEGIASGIETIAAGAGWLNGYFPVLTMVTCLGVIWAYRVALLAWSGLRDLWDALPLT